MFNVNCLAKKVNLKLVRFTKLNCPVGSIIAKLASSFCTLVLRVDKTEN